jgi:phage gpG-like protein
MAIKNNIPDFEGMATALKRDLVRYASRAGVNHFTDSFYNEGFTNVTLDPWQPRANDVDPGRRILVKSTALLNSIQVFTANEELIEIGSPEAHAEIHNNGGTIRIPITAKSRRYFWFMFKKTGKGMWKGLALTKKQVLTVNIPQRQFIGESATLMGQLDDWVVREINKRFKLA